jgi:parallel beta-helix repeat protein
MEDNFEGLFIRKHEKGKKTMIQIGRKNLLSAVKFVAWVAFCLASMSSIAVAKPIYLHVNNFAIRSAELGTSSDPYLTITAALNRASKLRLFARDRIIIRVQPGFYSAANGEGFPLCMLSGVDLEGVSNDLALIPVPIIQGGGIYDIGTERYIAVIAAGNASITGFTFRAIDGPDGTPGTSILCDDTSPNIERNRFEGNSHAGITVTGAAHPAIQENVFSGTNNWGMTLYGESYPQIRYNEFYSKNGVDCSDNSYPNIDDNTFSCESTGISAKGDSNPTITNNVLAENGDYGIIVRMNSTPMIENNDISNNHTGIYIGGGSMQNPDIGGGGRSDGGNLFNNNTWDIENHITTTIMARYNQWGLLNNWSSARSSGARRFKFSPECKLHTGQIPRLLFEK